MVTAFGLVADGTATSFPMVLIASLIHSATSVVAHFLVVLPDGHQPTD
ncbi:hypothetical protein [Streptomyces sp. NPDC048106]